MKYLLAIENKVTFKVVGSLTETASREKKFNFSLTCDRLDQETINTRLKDKSEQMGEFMQSITTGWADQRLVLADSGEPAEFDADSFALLMSVAGMPSVCFHAYLRAVAAKEKN
ncbi:MAG: hypothetical protein ACKVIH_01490 [Burkholderiales bacterium]